jgi:tRNA (uracil-5-)-methyltransferase TRM9
MIFLSGITRTQKPTAKMDSTTQNRLVEINRAFYREFAEPFAQTRERLQPGVLRLLPRVPSGARVLDLGCGSAETAHWLAEHANPSSYLGWDFSAELLGVASARRYPFAAQFEQADLLDAPWQRLEASRFERIFLFAALHHIPSLTRREAILHTATRLLADDGQLWMSNWQFQRDPKFAARILPWREAGLADRQVDAEDYLLDWRQGGRGLRYVHVVTDEERAHLARISGCAEKEFFHSDGKNGEGADYCVWEKI